MAGEFLKSISETMSPGRKSVVVIDIITKLKSSPERICLECLQMYKRLQLVLVRVRIYVFFILHNKRPLVFASKSHNISTQVIGLYQQSNYCTHLGD